MDRITFRNTCGCIVDEDLLSQAIHSTFPDFRNKPSQKRAIGGYGARRQPAISMNGKYYPVARLLAQYIWPEVMIIGMVVHHKDRNPLNNNRDNLVLMSRSEHTQFHRPIVYKVPTKGIKFRSLSVWNETAHTLIEIAKKQNISLCALVNTLAKRAEKESFRDELE